MHVRSATPPRQVRTQCNEFSHASVVGGALVFWAFGYAFAFGGDSPNEFIGDGQFFLTNTNAREYAFVFFQYTFAATSVTIVSYVSCCIFVLCCIHLCMSVCGGKVCEYATW